MSLRQSLALRGPLAAVCLFVFFAGCAAAPVAQPSAHAPQFEPEKFFAGRTRSSGVFENRVGKPRERFTTKATGRLRGKTLTLAQHFTFADGRTQDRQWTIRRLDAHHYEGTANDVVGRARGETVGNTFRFTYVVALQPGNPLSHVRLNQVMTLGVNGTVENHATISKLGVLISNVTEQFHRVP